MSEFLKKKIRVSSLSLMLTGGILLLLTGQAAGISPEEQLYQDLGAFDDPGLNRLLVQPPVSWQGPRGEQPFKQEPPDTQRDFRDLDQINPGLSETIDETNRIN